MLNLPVSDIDWVVTGATAETLLALGYKSIGKDFPVYLHPKSRQEYALARSERKRPLATMGLNSTPILKLVLSRICYAAT